MYTMYSRDLRLITGQVRSMSHLVEVTFSPRLNIVGHLYISYSTFFCLRGLVTSRSLGLGMASSVTHAVGKFYTKFDLSTVFYA